MMLRLDTGRGACLFYGGMPPYDGARQAEFCMVVNVQYNAHFMLPKKYKNIARTLVAKRSKAGLGLFTKLPIERRGFIIEYVGTVLSEGDANKKGGKYLFMTSSRRVVDGSARGNIARYINHSCRPNCEVEVKRGRILVFAKRAIRAGEELSYDYGKEYVGEYIKPFGCRCAKCGGL